MKPRYRRNWAMNLKSRQEGSWRIYSGTDPNLHPTVQELFDKIKIDFPGKNLSDLAIANPGGATYDLLCVRAE